MLKAYVSLFLLIFLLANSSCSEKQNDSSLKLEDIRPKSERDYTTKKIELPDTTKAFLSEYNNDSITLNIKYIKSINESNFLNRFPHLKSANRSIITADSAHQYTHEYYLFKDSNQMKNAFFNWLDCNGKKCESIKLFEERKIEPINLLVIATAKSIDILRSDQTISPEEWVDFVRFTRNYSDFKYIVFQKKNQKAKWLNYKERKLILKDKK